MCIGHASIHIGGFRFNHCCHSGIESILLSPIRYLPAAFQMYRPLSLRVILNWARGTSDAHKRGTPPIACTVKLLTGRLHPLLPTAGTHKLGEDLVKFSLEPTVRTTTNRNNPLGRGPPKRCPSRPRGSIRNVPPSSFFEFSQKQKIMIMP